MRSLQRTIAAAALAAVSGALVHAQPYHFSALSSSSVSSTLTLDGPAATALFAEPQGVCVDASGTIYVADTAFDLIRRISPAGTVQTLAGIPAKPGSADGVPGVGTFNQPTAVAVDASGNVYVADMGNDMIRKISPAGKVTTLAGAPAYGGSSDGTGSAAHFQQPQGLAVDADGNVYVADTGNDTIRKITPAGVVTTVGGHPGLAGSLDGASAQSTFNAPTAIAIGPNGTLYVADTGNNLIRTISASGNASTLAGTAGKSGKADGSGTAANFGYPLGITVDSAGNVYVGDTFNNLIRKVTAQGVVTTLAGSGSLAAQDGTGAAAGFSLPCGLALDASGNVIIADLGNSVIRKMTPAGVVTTVAGNILQAAGESDGPLGQARLFGPSGIAIDSAGTLYVTDALGYTVRSIANGIVSTVAGKSGVAGTATGAASSAHFEFETISVSGIAVDSSGALYVSDLACIRKIANGSVGAFSGSFPSNGQFAETDGVSFQANFAFPTGIAVDKNGTVYCADWLAGTIRKIAPDGTASTFAGALSNAALDVDGVGNAARFVEPGGVAVGANGVVYVMEADTLRKITPLGGTVGVVSTLAGVAGTSNQSLGTDGVGTDARFSGATGIAIDGSGNLFVADSGNHTIRKVTAAGVVTTIGGLKGAAGKSSGTGSSARFTYPNGIAVDASGTLYITDPMIDTIWIGTPDKAPVATNLTVSTAAGQALTTVLPAADPDGDPITFTLGTVTGGQATLNANQVTFTPTAGFSGTATVAFAATDSGGLVSNSGTLTITVLAPGAIVTQPTNQTAVGGGNATFGVTASGSGLTYQWKFNGTALTDGGIVSGASTSSLRLTGAGAASQGTYSVVVTGPNGSVTSNGATLTVTTDARLLNLSASATVGIGPDAMTVGFVVGGSGAKPVLLRGVGPGLAALGVAGTVDHPQLNVFNSASAQIDSGANWGGSAALAQVFTQVGAFNLPADSADAALLQHFTPGLYSVTLFSVTGVPGLGLEEAYDAGSSSDTSARLANLSAKANVGAGGNPLTAGFAVSGTQSVTVLLRGIGPALGVFGFSNALPKAMLTLYDSSQHVVATNTAWNQASTLGSSTVAASIAQPAVIPAIESGVSAFSLPADSLDAAMVATLPPGTYTVQLTGVGGATGVGLVEIYEVK